MHANVATPGRSTSRHVDSEQASQRVFVGASVLLFGLSTAATIAWGTSMSAMGEMPTAAGRSVSMAWIPICGRTWLETGASFLGMWAVMMIAMMLPSLMPMLARYRATVQPTDRTSLGGLTMWVGAGYFFVWTAFGVAVFPAGAAIAVAQIRIPALAMAAPLATGAIILLAGLLQFTRWKSRQLACCHATPAHGLPLSSDVRTAWRHGLRLGLGCVRCCAGLTAVLLVAGVMDLWAMATVATAIGIERRVPDGQWFVGIATGCAGAFLIARAVVP